MSDDEHIIDLSPTELSQLAATDSALANALLAATVANGNVATELAKATKAAVAQRELLTAEIIEGAPSLVEPVPEPEPEPDPDPPIDEPPPVDEPVTPVGEPLEFATGGEYAWLEDTIDLSGAPEWVRTEALSHGLTLTDGALSIGDPMWRDLGADRMQVSGGWNSDQILTMSDAEHRGAFLNVGTNHSWGDTCLWGTRVYNARGSHGHRVVMRCGDFVRGKEGHVVYANATADFELHHIVGIQHGAQLIQLVWRPTETLLPPEEWPENIAGGTLHLHHLCSIDGGVINTGMAVRASWPLTVFTPGHEHIVIEDVYQRTGHAKTFHHSTKGACRSHGSLLCAKSGASHDTEATGKTVHVRNYDVEVVDTDRSVMRFGDAEDIQLSDGRCVEHGKVGGIAVLSNVHRFRIDDSFQWAGKITVFDPASPYKQPLAVIDHTGGTLDIDPRSFQ